MKRMYAKATLLAILTLIAAINGPAGNSAPKQDNGQAIDKDRGRSAGRTTQTHLEINPHTGGRNWRKKIPKTLLCSKPAFEEPQSSDDPIVTAYGVQAAALQAGRAQEEPVAAAFARGQEITAKPLNPPVRLTTEARERVLAHVLAGPAPFDPPPFALSGDGHGGACPPGPPGAPPWPAMGPGFAECDPSDEQVEKLSDLRAKAMDKVAPLYGKLVSLEHAKHHALWQNEVNGSQINRLAKEISALHQEIDQIMTESIIESAQVLTAEQRRKVRLGQERRELGQNPRPERETK